MNARLLYSLCLYCLTPLLLARLLLRGFGDRRYWRGLGQRLALHGGAAPRPPCIWFHAASVGEVLAAVPLVEASAARGARRRLLVTTVTPTGAQMVRERLPDVEHRYLPFDLPGAVRRFMSRHRPSLLLIMETELWPNLVAACGRAAVPVLLLNARLSATSCRGYRRVRPLVAAMLEQFSLIAAQGERDAARFRELGAPDAILTVTGNLKFDVHAPADAVSAAESCRQRWGRERPVWIAASTHPGEEAAALAVDRRLRAQRPDVLTILAPRHPQRCAAVERLVREGGLRAARRTRWQEVTPATELLLIDTLGELWTFYAASDVCFVGGSLVPAGGHNLLEPASLGKPLLAGPHTGNFAEVSELLTDAGGLLRVADAEELAERIAGLLQDAALRAQFGELARQVVLRHRGGLQRTLALVGRFEGISEAAQPVL